MSALSDSFEYLCYGSTAIRNMFALTARGSNLESDVYPANIEHLHNIYTMSAQRLRRRPTLYKCYANVLYLLGRRQILTTKVGPRAVMLKYHIHP